MLKSDLSLHYSFFIFPDFNTARQDLTGRTSKDLCRVFEAAGISPSAIRKFADVEIYGDNPSECLALKRTKWSHAPFSRFEDRDFI